MIRNERIEQMLDRENVIKIKTEIIIRKKKNLQRRIKKITFNLNYCNDLDKLLFL